MKSPRPRGVDCPQLGRSGVAKCGPNISRGDTCSGTQGHVIDAAVLRHVRQHEATKAIAIDAP